jgi:uncharacterized lipoprotein YajG
MKKMFKWMVFPLALLVIAGCSSAPEMEETAATQAMAAAESVKAAVYAPDAWQTAEDTLQAARTEKAAQDGRFTLFRNYGDAKALFESVAGLAATAKMEAESQREIVKQETETLLTQTRALLDTVTTKLAKMRGGKDTKAEIEMMKQDAAAFKQQLDDAQGDLDRGDYESAKTKVQTIMNKVADLKKTIKA